MTRTGARRAAPKRRSKAAERRAEMREVERLKTRRRRAVRAGMTLVGLVIFGVVLATAALRTVIVQDQVAIDNIGEELTEARALNQQLRLELAELEAPERILSAAFDRLGMVRPTNRGYLEGVRADRDPIPPPPSGIDPFAPAPVVIRSSASDAATP